MKVIYKVTVLNWEKYNKGLKPGHKNIMISTRFLEDAKIKMLSPGGKLLFLGLLLRCGDLTTNSVECSHDVLVMLAGGRGYVVLKLLNQLQSLQLVTYEKTEFLNNRIELNRKERNRKEVNTGAPGEKQAAPLLPEAAPTPLHDLILIWNQNCGKLPKVKHSNKHRDRKIKAVWAQQTPPEWTATVQKMAASDFCNGKSNTGWKASFDFLVKPESWLKVNEGKYDNNKGVAHTRATQIYDNLDRLEQKINQDEVKDGQ